MFYHLTTVLAFTSILLILTVKVLACFVPLLRSDEHVGLGRVSGAETWSIVLVGVVATRAMFWNTFVLHLLVCFLPIDSLTEGRLFLVTRLLNCLNGGSWLLLRLLLGDVLVTSSVKTVYDYLD